MATVKKTTVTKPKTTTVTKPKTTTSKIVNNKVTATKPGTTVTKPTTAPKTPAKTGSSIINNKVTATKPGTVGNDTYVPMMSNVLGDYYNKSVNNNNVTTTPKASTGGSGTQQLSSIALQPDGNSYQYNDDGSFKILSNTGQQIGWGAKGTEGLTYANEGGTGSPMTSTQPTANAEYTALLEKLNGLQSSFDTRYADLESSWGNKYDSLQSQYTQAQEEASAKYQALLDQFNYIQSVNKGQTGATGSVGGSTSAPVDTGTPTGDVTAQNSYNDILYKYLQNIWGGGF